MEIVVERPKPGVTLETLHRVAVFNVVRVSVALGMAIDQPWGHCNVVEPGPTSEACAIGRLTEPRVR
jgi:hypothetical protein